MEDESALAPRRVAVPGRVLWVVLAIWMVALGFRVAYITQINPDQPLTGDGGYYHALGNSLPKEGFRRAFEFSMVTEETAAHPPGYPVLLSLGSRIGLTTPDDHRMLTALVGSLAVPLLALSAARLAGRRRRGPPPSARMVGWAAIGAAVIATVNVNMWSWDALILAEPLVMTATSLWLYALLVYDDRPGPGAVLTAGLALGVAAATRSELILAGVVILVLLWRHRSLPWQRLALHSAAFGAGALMVLGPWLWSNMHRFEEPVLMTTGVGTTMLQGNCDSAFYGPLTGYSDYSCFDRSRSLMNLDMDASERDLVARNIAGDYIQTHRARLPVVAAARIARTFGFFRPVQQSFFIEVLELRGPHWVVWGGLISWQLLLPLGIAGVVLARREGQLIAPVILVAGSVVAAVSLTQGADRYRMALEPLMIAYAGLAAARCLAVVGRSTPAMADTGLGRWLRKWSPTPEPPVVEPLDSEPLDSEVPLDATPTSEMVGTA